jgi:UDP-N-acetylmuramate dehydrogenase
MIQKNIPLHDKNWFKTGGPAKYYCEPNSEVEFQEALAFARTNNLDIFVLGQGANILISDDGFDGLVIKPKLNKATSLNSSLFAKTEELRDAILITAQSGLSMHDLILFCLDHNIIGLEEFSGIPGTVGGSVYINLHYFEFLLAQFLVEARVIHKKTGVIETVNKDWFAFGYDFSTLHHHEYYLIDATFMLKTASDLEIAYARGRRTEIIRHRESRYPKQGTCGSFFRNFHTDEVTLISNGKKMIYVAYYLDKIGVKGQLRMGDAQVSYQHANMLVNLGNATTQNLIDVARKMQDLVFDQFGVLPQPECELVGFKEYPLKR